MYTFTFDLDNISHFAGRQVFIDFLSSHYMEYSFTLKEAYNIIFDDIFMWDVIICIKVVCVCRPTE